MLDEACFAYLLDGAYDRFGQLARELGRANPDDSDQAASEKFLEIVKELCRVCEIPTLEQYGIEKDRFMEQLEKMASDAMESGSPSNTRKPLDKEDLIRIYQSRWNVE